MKNAFNPRPSEPIAAALMGAGFFIFAAVITGGPFWSYAEQALWRRFLSHARTMPSQLLLIKGQGREGLDAPQRRLKLAEDLRLLGQSGAKAVVLEAWLDEPSQLESQTLLADLLNSSKALPAKSAHSLRATVASLKTRLNADASLALAMQAAGNVLLPVGVEASAAMIPVSGTVWEKAHPYEVLVKGKGSRQLEGDWRIVRAPLAAFRESCLGLVLLPPPQTGPVDLASDVPAVFQVRGHWVNGLGLESARTALDIPGKGIHFTWREGRLRALEMGGTRYPITPQGHIWLPPRRDRASLPWMELQSLDGSAVMGSLRGKVVFYQPWPTLLGDDEAFAGQRELCAGLLSGMVQMQPEEASDLPMELGLWILCALGLWLMSRSTRWVLPLVLALIEFTRFIQFQAPLVKPLGMLVSGSLIGLGLGILAEKRRMESSRLWLRGHVAPGSQDLWRERLSPWGGKNLVEGVYVALRPKGAAESPRWSAWASSHGVFLETMDSLDLGFVIPLSKEDLYPLAVIETLRRVIPASIVTSSRGSLEFDAAEVFDGVRWTVSGQPKTETMAMLAMGQPGSFLLSELDYSQVRQQVKIQLLGERQLIPGAAVKKIFNIIEVF